MERTFPRSERLVTARRSATCPRELDLPRAQDLITLATSQYAKRQMTWFRGEEGVEWFRGSGDDALIVKSVLSYLQRNRQKRAP